MQTSAHVNIPLLSLSLKSTVFFICTFSFFLYLYFFFCTAEDATNMGKVLNQHSIIYSFTCYSIHLSWEGK